MFETAEVGAKLPDAAFRGLKDRLRLELIDLQQKLRVADCPVIIILSGIKGAGVVDTVNLLNTWMDPRWIATTAFDEPTDEERERPPFWRIWRSLPAAGSIGLYLGGWYQTPISGLCTSSLSRGEFEDHLVKIKTFETMLADDGALILKFWLHLGKVEQRKRLKRTGKDPLVGLRASDQSWTTPRNYDKYVRVGTTTIRSTQSAAAPWFIVEGGDDNFRRATVLSTVAENLKRHIEARKASLKLTAHTLKKVRKAAEKARKKAHGKHKAKSAADTKLRAPVRQVLDTIDMTAKLDTAAYAKEFLKQQSRLHELQARARVTGLSTVVAFEGWDAAGKGGAIRRLTFALNARDYHIVPIAAPTDEERSHHYLWRFWRHLSRSGRMTVFDRSWYGRVLVERVENLAEESAWMRAYSEINDFENQIAEHGAVVVKLWLHLTADEQLKRFKRRANLPYKKWKLTDDDWRNRDKWSAYEDAVNDMISRTSTTAAPWHLISANDKHYCRVTVLQTVADAMERALQNRGKQPRK